MFYLFAVLAFVALEIWLYLSKRRYTLWVLIGLSVVSTAAGLYLLFGLPAVIYWLLLDSVYGLDLAFIGYYKYAYIFLAVVLGFIVLRLVVAFFLKGNRVSGLFVGLTIAMTVLLPIAIFVIGLHCYNEYFPDAGLFFVCGAGLSFLLNWMFPIQKFLQLRTAPRQN